MSYVKNFTPYYPNGWENKPSTTTPISAEVLSRYDAAIQYIENYLEQQDPTLISTVTILGTTNMVVGETQELNVSIVPNNATNKSIIWSSSDDSIASVDSTGLITGLAVGSAVITAVAEDGGGAADNFEIIVSLE